MLDDACMTLTCKVLTQQQSINSVRQRPGQHHPCDAFGPRAPRQPHSTSTLLLLCTRKDSPAPQQKVANTRGPTSSLLLALLAALLVAAQASHDPLHCRRPVALVGRAALWPSPRPRHRTCRRSARLPAPQTDETSLTLSFLAFFPSINGRRLAATSLPGLSPLRQRLN
jgi:hypothetical protein